MMSSTMTTRRPVMSLSRSFRIRTTPLDDVAEPYDDTAMNSSSHGIGSAWAKSVRNITAPLSTQISSGGRSRSWSAATAAGELADLVLQRVGADQGAGDLAGVAVRAPRDPPRSAVSQSSAMAFFLPLSFIY